MGFKEYEISLFIYMRINLLITWRAPAGRSRSSTTELVVQIDQLSEMNTLLVLVVLAILAILANTKSKI